MKIKFWLLYKRYIRISFDRSLWQFLTINTSKWSQVYVQQKNCCLYQHRNLLSQERFLILIDWNNCNILKSIEDVFLSCKSTIEKFIVSITLKMLFFPDREATTLSEMILSFRMKLHIAWFTGNPHFHKKNLINGLGIWIVNSALYFELVFDSRVTIDAGNLVYGSNVIRQITRQQ